MIATTSQCLSTEQLHQLLSGGLDSDQFDAASDHVDGCTHCQATIENISLGGSFSPIDRLVDPLHAESECQFAIHRLLDASPRTNPINGPNGEAASISQLGPYRILGDLGSGGMGTVCLAEHERLKRRCAIKLLPPGRVSQPGWLKRFEREMAAVASLEHPGIVRANDAGTEAGWHYLVMEYLDGLDIARVVSATGKLPIADACEIVRQAALALLHVHGSGLVHRDIKPSNLMLTRQGSVKLLDLGLVLAGDDLLSCDDRLTTVGHLMGTLPAMSPEQLIDSRRVDAAADVYSLGATLYRLIGGQWPFSGEGGMASRVLAITSKPASRLSSVRDGIDAGLDTLVSRMMERNAERRPSADQVAEQITQWTAGADLKKLLRDAQQNLPPAHGDASPPLSVSAMPAPGYRPPGNRSGTWIAGGFRAFGFLAAGMLLATVIIQIRTDHGNVVVTTDGRETQVEVVPDDQAASKSETNATTASDASPERLYLGKDFQHWISVFQREQQIESIGQAMRAVELLSQGQPQRKEAARITLQLANEYGTLRVDESPDDQSRFSGGSSPAPERFMGYLTEVFPKYLPEPGLREIDRQLAAGNDKAKIASILLLYHYMHGIFQNTGYPSFQEAAKQHIATLAKTEAGQQQLNDLLQHLGEAFASLKSVSHESTTGQTSHSSQLVQDATYARSQAWGTAVDVVAASKTIQPPAWIAQHVIDEVQRAVAAYRERLLDPETGNVVLETTSMMGFGGLGPGGMGGGGMGGGVVQYVRPTWMLDTPVLLAALEMRREGRLEVPTQFAVDVLTHPTANFYAGGSYVSPLELLAEIDPTSIELLNSAVETKLAEYETAYAESGTAAPALEALNREGLFMALGAFYAKHVNDPSAALQRIENLQTLFQTAFSTSYSSLNPMIESLRARLNEQQGERASD